MAKSLGMNYKDISNTVYCYGRMQGNADAFADYPPLGGQYSDFSTGTYEELANRVIVSWASETSLDDYWYNRDCNCLRDMFNLGHRHSMEDRSK